MFIHVTGEFAGRWLIVSLIATPLLMLFPNSSFTQSLVKNRRYFGVAAFLYALAHTIFYLLKEPMSLVKDEFFRIGIITGWIAFIIFIPLALTSTDNAIKRMGGNWKKLQRWVYLAAFLTFLHWALASTRHAHWVPATVQFSPVIILSLYRLWKYFGKK
jgi:sulfoxide reductase heme-binding subunit YedZ